MNCSKEKNKAFTIVEMLVVVAIIAILATVMTVGIGNSVVKSRDSKRMADITMINKALGLYAAEKREFPAEDPCVGVTGSNDMCVEGWEIVQGTKTSGSQDAGGGGWVAKGTAFKDALKTYLPSLPTDPKNISVLGSDGSTHIYYNYLYNSPSDHATYYLRTRLELDNGGNFGTNKCFGFLGAKSSSVTQPDWASMPAPDNNCNS